MSSIYLPYQKHPRWNIDQATIALNCARLGLPVPSMLAMPMWEGAGKNIYDFSGNQNTGNFGTGIWTSGRLTFDGGASSNITFTQLALTAWTVVIQLSADGYTDSWILTNGAGSSFIGRDSSGAFRVYDSGGNHEINTDTYIVGTLETWIVTYDGAIYRYYINGEYKGQFSGSGNTLNIDRLNNCMNGYRWSGKVDYNYIFPSALTGSQIKILTNNSYGMFELIRSPQWIVPAAATTAAPTTIAPTSLAPTTLAPTTSIPATTSAPTTSIYTTIGPTTTLVATTPPPTSLAPTSLAPTTLAPTTAAPTTLPPTTTAPTTSAPTLPPTSLAPTSLAPTTVAPTTVAPTTTAPTLAPTTIAPTTSAPTTSAPTAAPTTIGPTTAVPTLAPTTLLTTLAPTTNIPETICVKNLSSIITKELSPKSLITKEIRFNGYLC